MATRAEIIRQKLIDAGVKNLQEFGYPGASSENIMTGSIFPMFFDKMLEDTIEEWSTPPSVRKEAEKLRAEIAADSMR